MGRQDGRDECTVLALSSVSDNAGCKTKERLLQGQRSASGLKEWHTGDLLNRFCTQERVLLATLYCFVYICYGHEMTYEQSRDNIAAGYGCKI